MKEEHLKEYVEDSWGKNAPGCSARKELRGNPEKEKPIGVIDVVHGAINLFEVTARSVRNQRKRVTHLKEVYQMTVEPNIVNEVG